MKNIDIKIKESIMDDDEKDFDKKSIGVDIFEVKTKAPAKYICINDTRYNDNDGKTAFITNFSLEMAEDLGFDENEIEHIEALPVGGIFESSDWVGCTVMRVCK